MPSSYTTSLRLTLPATGELSGQWGNTVNTGITELLDAAVAGTTVISTWGGAGVAYTLSNNSGTADEARRMFIVATGTPGEAKNVICPAVSKLYVFRNDTTGGFALTLKTPSGTGVSVPAGQYRWLYCDGTNVVEAFNSVGSLASLNVTGNTTLGDASTDTVQVNGYMGVGGAASADTSVYVRSSALTGTTQWGVLCNPIASSAATSGLRVVQARAQTAASAFTAANVYAFYADNAALGSTSAITNLHGVYINDQTQGTNNFGITSIVSSGTNKWNIYASGTAANYFAGDIAIGASGFAPTADVSFIRGDTIGAIGRIGFNITTAERAYIEAFRHTAGGQLTDLTFGTMGSERMRIDSAGNVGIGTTSPATKVDSRIDQNNTYSSTAVSAAADTALTLKNNTTSGALGNYVALRFEPNDVFARAEICAVYDAVNASALTFKTEPNGGNATERMRLDSSGNLGLGVTPSAWGTSAQTAIQLSAGGALSNRGAGNTDSTVTHGAYYDGTNWRYVYSSVAAARYEMTGANAGSTHAWYVSAGGTAGTAITFTQAMTLDANGNLAVGNTGTFAKGSATGTPTLIFAKNDGNQAADRGVAIDWVSPGTGLAVSGSRTTGRIISASSFAGTQGGYLRFDTENTSGTVTERARITSDGYLRMASGSLGIQFNGNTAATNALDDYEEGTFTPTITGSTTGGTGTYSVQTGNYTKVGNLVTCTVRLTWSAHTGTGNMRISGLPFTAATQNSGYAAAYVENMTVTGQVFTGGVSVGNTFNTLYSMNNGAAAPLAIDTAAAIFVVFSYFA